MVLRHFGAGKCTVLLCMTWITPTTCAPLASGSSLSALWPRPGTDSRASGATPLLLDPTRFKFVSTGQSERLTRLFVRFHTTIFSQKAVWSRTTTPSPTLNLNTLTVVVPSNANLEGAPALGDDERFELWVNTTGALGGAELRATTFSGVHRGIEAFAQMTLRLGNAVIINATTSYVTAAPQYPYRGLMVDTARHYQPIPALLQTLDGMAANALNVFHWHLTDAQAFPWNSTSEPRLVRGAYRPDLTYSRTDLEAVVAYASDRAIRVVVEVDMPGHAASWAVGRPDVVVDCPPDDTNSLFDGSYQSASQLDPSTNATFTLLDSLIGELTSIFPDRFMHFGGDEVRCATLLSTCRHALAFRGTDC